MIARIQNERLNNENVFAITCILRERCPSLFSSIAIELNVPRDEFSSMSITLGRGFKRAGSVFFDIDDAWENDFLNPSTSVHICITGWCYECV